MAKNILRDIMTSERKTIRQVPLGHARRKTASAEEEDPIETDILYENEEIMVDEVPEKRKSSLWVWGAAAIFLVAMSIALIASFSGATVTVTPKSAEVTVTGDFNAIKIQAGKSQTATLAFETVSLDKTGEVVITADQTKRVSEKASGTIIVYNSFSDKPQRLIKNTRFESSSGLIYRIDHSIVIPGKTMENGKAIPGSIETVVYADSSGDEYNSGLTDFTIPGFKTDPVRYAKFSARSKTPLSGGIDGLIKAPSEDAEQKARAALRVEFEKNLRDFAKRGVPDGYILFDNAFAFAFESLPIESKGEDKAVIKEKVIGAAFIFRRADLAKTIAVATMHPYNGLPVEIPGLEKLSFNAGTVAEKNPATAQELKFKLAGTAKIVWLFEEEKLKAALIGKPKIELAGILASFPTVEKVDVTLRPFWKRSFPDNSKKINIEKSSVDEKS